MISVVVYIAMNMLPCKVVDEVLTHNRYNNDTQTNTYEQAYYEVIVMHCV